MMRTRDAPVDAPAAGTWSLLRHPAREAGDGRMLAITSADAGWQYVSLAVHRLHPGQRLSRPGDDQEVLALVLEGQATVGVDRERFEGVGGRASVFDTVPAGVVIVEPGRDVEVVPESETLVAIAAAPGGDRRVTWVRRPADVFTETRGTGNTARRIHHLLPPAADAGRLIAFEVYTPGGNWSSYPPHKHDTDDPPRESYLEEVYFYRFARPSGFAVQRIYTPDRALDETLTVTDGDLVLVPRGYHVVGAAAGYDTYYLNVMAGPTRLWRFTVDPDHAWLMDWDPERPKG